MENMETYVYMAEVQYHNEATEEIDTIVFAVCAKSYSEAEEKVKKEVGEYLVNISSIVCTSYVPLI
jgi:hypothetical protein